MKNSKLKLHFLAGSCFAMAACGEPISTNTEIVAQSIQEVTPSPAFEPPVKTLSNMNEGWKRIELSQEAVQLDMLGEPMDCQPVVETAEMTSRCYHFVTTKPEKILVTIWANYPDGGLLSDEAIQAWFDGTATGFELQAGSGQTVQNSSDDFLGFPAVELSVTDELDGQNITTRRLRFVVDGAELVLSVASSSDGSLGQQIYDRIRDSISISEFSYIPNTSGTEKVPGVSFQPPANWKREQGTNAAELVRYRNATKLIVVKAAGQRAYLCTNYRDAVDSQFSIVAEPPSNFGSGGVMTFTTVQPVPDYDLNLKVVHYCWNSRLGAVALEGISEEQTFFRWRPVFEGTARSFEFQ